MSKRREITPEELAAIWALAAEYPDLRTVAADLTELADLRRRVVRGESAIVAVRASQLELGKALAQLGLKAK